MNSSSDYSRSSRSHKHRHTSKSKDKKSRHHRERSRHHHSSNKKSKESKHRSKDSEKSKKEIKKSKDKSHTHHSKHSSYHSDHSSKKKQKRSSSSSSNHKNLKEDLLVKNDIMNYPFPLRGTGFFPPMNPTQFKYQNLSIPNILPNNLPNLPNLNPMNVNNVINNNEGYNDKIVKDQNFLNSEEKLFDNIVSNEMSLKNLFSDCQFSEKYLGKILYRTIKKQTFDSNIVIFDDNDDDGKKFVIPKQSEFIQKKIENLKINTQKIKFEGLENIYKKIIDERRSEIEKENNNIKSNKNNE